MPKSDLIDSTITGLKTIVTEIVENGGVTSQEAAHELGVQFRNNGLALLKLTIQVI